MQVLIPSALRSYTGASRVQASGATLGEVLADLERQFPGLRFRMVDEQDRIRPHMRVFVDAAAAARRRRQYRAGAERRLMPPVASARAGWPRGRPPVQHDGAVTTFGVMCTPAGHARPSPRRSP